jgi:hypothetical protein
LDLGASHDHGPLMSRITRARCSCARSCGCNG